MGCAEGERLSGDYWGCQYWRVLPVVLFDCCRRSLHITRQEIESLLEESGSLSEDVMDEYNKYKDNIVNSIMTSRYKNMYNLLGDHLAWEQYLGIVKNKILVDMQVSSCKLSVTNNTTIPS